MKVEKLTEKEEKLLKRLEEIHEEGLQEQKRRMIAKGMSEEEAEATIVNFR
ncbi:MAG: hypothetical protein SCJ94_12205 [Bacillota bacterium]|nr:hypothetical protein [Bacillota bacterium]